MATQCEPINVTVAPIFEDAWKEIMKWPPKNVVYHPIDHNYLKDPDILRTIYLIVDLPKAPSPFLPPPPPANPLHLHWSIHWEIAYHMEQQFHRIIQIERAASFLGHLTNWGPMTKVHRLETEPQTLRIPIVDMTAEQRRQLERIALTQPVKDPDGIWNCQHWIADVLTRATIAEHDADGQLVHPPLISVQQKDDTLWAARNLKLE